MGAIDDIKDRLDIVDIIQEHGVSLRKSGRSYLGFCPFHQNTRTPAFTVYPDTQSFYCFGCQASGSVFDFIMRKQGLDFRDALQQLAPRAGIELQPKTEEDEQHDQQRTRLLAMNTLAARYFNYLLLQHRRGEPGRAYLEQRDLHPDTVEAFQLGYSLNERTHLLTYLTDKKGYAPEEVEAAGLAIYSEQHGWYDRFRGRLIFPIRDRRGEVVGFGGRALGDVQPKYMNTPQTPLFDKRRVLYGLDLARNGIRAADATVIVEGYIDVITAYQHGFRNVVAPLGTALTSEHVAAIKKLSHNVYLALDADAAGQRATLKGLGAFESEPGTTGGDTAQPTITAQGMIRWQRDMTLRIIRLPEGRDPDDVIRHSPQQWQALIDEALPVMDFYIQVHTAGRNLHDPQEQRAALDHLLPLVRQLDSTQQRVYVARLEQVIGMRAELILDLLRAAPPPERARKRAAPPPPQQPDTPPPDAAPHQHPALRREEYLLALLFRHPSAVQRIETALAHDLHPFSAVREMLGDTLASVLEQTTNRLIWQAWHKAGTPLLLAEQHTPPDGDPPWMPPDWARALDERLQTHLAHVATHPMPEQPPYRALFDAEQCARQLRREQVRRWQYRLTEQMHHTEDEEENQRLRTLVAELLDFAAQMRTPHRVMFWSDLRDTIGKPDE